MEYAIIIFSFIKSIFIKIPNFFGYKLVPKEEYQIEYLEVKENYTQQSTLCKDETKNGAMFSWGNKLPSVNHEKYFEIKDNQKIYFTNKGRVLWIRRQ